MLAATQARIFDFQMHVMISADNKEQLEYRKMQVKGYFDAMGMGLVALMFEQEKVLKSISPSLRFHSKLTDHTFLFYQCCTIFQVCVPSKICVS